MDFGVDDGRAVRPEDAEDEAVGTNDELAVGDDGRNLGVAADRGELHIARRRVDAALAPDRADLHVAAGRVDFGVARYLAELHVARAGLDLDRPEAPVALDVGRARLGVDARVVRAADLNENVGPAHEPLPAADVDQDLVPTLLDPRLLDGGDAGLAVAQGLQRDRGLVGVGGLEANLARPEPHVQADVAGRREGLGPHRFRRSGSRCLGGRWGRRSMRTSTCPNGIG